MFSANILLSHWDLYLLNRHNTSVQVLRCDLAVSDADLQFGLSVKIILTYSVQSFNKISEISEGAVHNHKYDELTLVAILCVDLLRKAIHTILHHTLGNHDIVNKFLIKESLSK